MEVNKIPYITSSRGAFVVPIFYNFSFLRNLYLLGKDSLQDGTFARGAIALVRARRPGEN